MGRPGALAQGLESARLTPSLVALRAAFVTLREPPQSGSGGAAGELRGCIGTIEAHEALYESVIRNAAAAAFDDPRFAPVTAPELARLRIEVSALTPARRVGGLDEIVLGRDGVQLRQGACHSVFLPQVAVEQGWDATRLLEQLARKAGLPADAWRQAELRTFQAEVFGELSD